MSLAASLQAREKEINHNLKRRLYALAHKTAINAAIRL
jgi:hypothetical protein